MPSSSVVIVCNAAGVPAGRLPGAWERGVGTLPELPLNRCVRSLKWIQRNIPWSNFLTTDAAAQQQHLTSRARRRRSVVLVCQLAKRVVHINATERRQVGTEQAFLHSGHPERVDRRMVVQVAGHVDWQQTLVRHRRQLPCAELCHFAASISRPTRNTNPDSSQHQCVRWNRPIYSAGASGGNKGPCSTPKRKIAPPPARGWGQGFP